RRERVVPGPWRRWPAPARQARRHRDPAGAWGIGAWGVGARGAVRYPCGMTEASPSPEPQARPFRRMAERFRGYLPVVVDVETGGFDWNRHALLELAAIPIEIDDN